MYILTDLPYPIEAFSNYSLSVCHRSSIFVDKVQQDKSPYYDRNPLGRQCLYRLDEFFDLVSSFWREIFAIIVFIYNNGLKVALTSKVFVIGNNQCT